MYVGWDCGFWRLINNVRSNSLPWWVEGTVLESVLWGNVPILHPHRGTYKSKEQIWTKIPGFFVFKFYFFLILCVHLLVYVGAWTWKFPWVSEMVSDPLHLEIEAVASFQMWVQMWMPEPNCSSLHQALETTKPSLCNH